MIALNNAAAGIVALCRSESAPSFVWIFVVGKLQRTLVLSSRSALFSDLHPLISARYRKELYLRQCCVTTWESPYILRRYFSKNCTPITFLIRYLVWPASISYFSLATAVDNY